MVTWIGEGSDSGFHASCAVAAQETVTGAPVHRISFRHVLIVRQGTAGGSQGRRSSGRTSRAPLSTLDQLGLSGAILRDHAGQLLQVLPHRHLDRSAAMARLEQLDAPDRHAAQNSTATAIAALCDGAKTETKVRGGRYTSGAGGGGQLTKGRHRARITIIHQHPTASMTSNRLHQRFDLAPEDLIPRLRIRWSDVDLEVDTIAERAVDHRGQVARAQQ
jgi:hypothetical protein